MNFSKIDYITIVSNLGRRSKIDKLDHREFLKHAQDNAPHVGATTALHSSKRAPGELYAYTCAHTGIRVALRLSKSEAFFVAQYSGRVLPNTKVLEHYLAIVQAYDKNARITRVDVAFDKLDPDGELHAAYARELAENIARNAVRTGRIIQSDGGRTLYLGSRHSVNFARIYQKRFTDKGDLYCRHEIEIKPSDTLLVADITTGQIFAHARYQLAKMMQYAIPESSRDARDYFSDGAMKHIVPPPRAETDRSHWFRMTVLPAFEKLLEEDSTEAAYILGEMRAILFDAKEGTGDIESAEFHHKLTQPGLWD